MQNALKEFSLLLIATSIGLAGCSTPITKQLTQHSRFMNSSTLGISSQFMDEEKMTLSLTIPLK